MRLTTSQLEALVAVAENGSISRAAEQLRLSQPTVSATLARLELQASTPLLARSSSGTVLTPEGQQVCALARAALNAVDDVGSALAGLSAGTAPVVIAASFTVAEQLLPIWLTGCPVPSSVEVRNSQEVQERVLAGTAEVGLVEGARLAPGLQEHVVGHDELIVVVTPGHPWTGRAPLTLAELTSPPEGVGPLAVREEGSGAREVLMLSLSSHGLSAPREVTVVGSTSAILTTVRHAGAHAVVPREAVAADLERGSLCAVPLEEPLGRELRLVVSASASRRPAAQTVVEHVLEHARATASPAPAP